MTKISAGLLLYRKVESGIEVMLVHPGGPFWAKKDDGSWSVPKGIVDENEDLKDAARREFEEEIGQPAPKGKIIELGSVKYGDKKVFCWAVESDFATESIQSNLVKIEWPPRSGKLQDFPECDKAEWFEVTTAKTKILKGQQPFIERITELA